jgi:hypothetical protein
MSEERPLEIEVRKWDAHSFTIEGVNDQLEKLLKEQKIIRTLALRLRLRLLLLRIRFIRARRLNMKDLTDLRQQAKILQYS